MSRSTLFRSAVPSLFAVAAVLALAGPAPAQRASGTLIVRVDEGGLPVTDADVSVFVRRERRTVARTGTTGLAAVDQLSVEITRGTQVTTHVLRCESEVLVVLVPETERIDGIPERCSHAVAGSFFWGENERIAVSMDGDRATLAGTRGVDVEQELSGFRFSGSFLFTALLGEEFDDDNDGIGSELRVFYLWPSGLGVGAGGSVTRHDVRGASEDLWKWSAFLEPRYTFLLPRSKFRPHVLGRVSRNWFAYEDGVLLSETGWGFGGGAGVAYPLAGWLGAEIGIYYGWLSVEAESFSRSGSELQLVGGLRFR